MFSFFFTGHKPNLDQIKEGIFIFSVRGLVKMLDEHAEAVIFKKNCILERLHLMFWPWTFGHLLVIKPNRNSGLVSPPLRPSVYPLILHFLPVPPSNRWWPCSHSRPPAALVVLLASFRSCPRRDGWPGHFVSLSLGFPPTPPPLLSPLPFHTPPANGLPCPSPAIPLSISDSEAARGDEGAARRDERRGKGEEAAAHCSPEALALTAASVAR